MAKKKYTLREFLHSLNVREDDVDVSVDGTECYIAVCGGDIKLAPEAEAEFGDALDNLYMNGNCVCGSMEDDDIYCDWNEFGIGDGGRLRLAERLLYALAGYCESSLYDKWFTDPTAQFI